jgi:hypothetical protein
VSSPLYAISELFIVVAAIWAVYKLLKMQQWLAATGSMILGTIAALGAVRYGFSLVEELALVHKSASQIGGAIAITLIGVQFIFTVIKDSWSIRVSVMIVILSSVFAIAVAPAIGMGLLVTWILVPIFATAYHHHSNLAQRLISTALVSIFLLNFLLVRQSSILGPIYSWHIYHTLIAIWLIAIVFVLNSNPQRVELT